MEKFRTKTGRIVLDAMLTAVALSIFVIELQIPSLTPIPGIKLGLSNIITLVAMFLLGPLDALAVTLLRILLGCILAGNVMSLAYSLAGGLLSYLVMVFLRKIVSGKQIFICSIFCAMVHNLGQIIVAVLITKTAAVFFYLPILMVSGIITGAFTGLTAQLVINRLKKLKVLN